jgi:transposase
MDTDKARALYARRKEINEPTFGILKDQMNGRRFLLRGLANVRAEFNLLATAFNLRTLWRLWSKLIRSGSNVNTIIPDRLAKPIIIKRFFDTNHKTAFVLNFA